MKKKYLTLILIGYVFSGYANDSLSIKRHTVYFMPSGCFLTDGVSNVLWVPVGYDYQLNKKQFLGIWAEVVAAYEKAGWYDFTTTPAEKITGYGINIEHKIFIKNKFYYSTNLFYRHTKFYEKEILDYAVEHTYFIINDLGALNLKVGLASFSRKHIFLDFGVGGGLKYISENTFDRLKDPSIKRGDNQGNYFGDKHLFRPNFIIQFKVGYNF